MWFDCEHGRKKTDPAQGSLFDGIIFSNTISTREEKRNAEIQIKRTNEIVSKHLLNSCCSKKTGHSQMLIKTATTTKETNSGECYMLQMCDEQMPFTSLNKWNAHRHSHTLEFRNRTKPVNAILTCVCICFLFTLSHQNTNTCRGSYAFFHSLYCIFICKNVEHWIIFLFCIFFL